MMDELLSMAKGTSEKTYDWFDRRQSAVAWVWLNDMLLGSKGIHYNDSQWYVDNIDAVDPALRHAFESRIQYGSAIAPIKQMKNNDINQEEISKHPSDSQSISNACEGNASSCGEAGAVRDPNATNDGAALQSADGASLGACGCSTNVPASTFDSVSTQTSSGSCCR